MKIFEPWWTMALPSDPTAPAGVPLLTPPPVTPILAPAPAVAGAPQAGAGPGAPRRGVFRNDHVLFRPSTEWRAVEARFIDETVASDHRPVLVVLEWTGLP
jgi:endonuclease/exonuclease/phosphatase family metal-dependent hydrolase